MPVGAVCEPRLNSHRSMGNERDAGWERMRGMSKAERAAMPPDVKSAVEMVKIWMACVADIVVVKYIDFNGVLDKCLVVASASQ